LQDKRENKGEIEYTREKEKQRKKKKLQRAHSIVETARQNKPMQKPPQHDDAAEAFGIRHSVAFRSFVLCIHWSVLFGDHRSIEYTRGQIFNRNFCTFGLVHSVLRVRNRPIPPIPIQSPVPIIFVRLGSLDANEEEVGEDALYTIEDVRDEMEDEFTISHNGISIA